MSQRDSGYERKELDLYETPEWVTKVLLPELVVPLRGHRHILEPACGSGKMVRVLESAGYSVTATDIETGDDFLVKMWGSRSFGAVVTNPPYALAEPFISRALELTEPTCGFVAMLLRTDFDHAKTRQHLFGKCKQFAKKIVLTKRIKWFEDSKGSPSFNHAWFIWDWSNSGLAPQLAYGP